MQLSPVGVLRVASFMKIRADHSISLILPLYQKSINYCCKNYNTGQCKVGLLHTSNTLVYIIYSYKSSILQQLHNYLRCNIELSKPDPWR